MKSRPFIRYIKVEIVKKRNFKNPQETAILQKYSSNFPTY